MSTNNSGFDSIDEKFLDRKDVFALEFKEGLVFLEVDGWEQTKYEPYTGVGEVQPESDSGFQRLEHESDDILHIEDKDEKVLHAAIGQSPSDIRRYTNYPEGETRLRTLPNLGVPRPGSGHDFGHVDGNDSPYDNPSAAQELVIPPGVHLDFSFYNPDQNEAKEPVLNIKLREYNVNVVNPSNNRNLVNRVVSPGSPMPIYPVGGMDQQASYRNLKDKWGVRAMTRSEASNIGGGR